MREVFDPIQDKSLKRTSIVDVDKYKIYAVNRCGDLYILSRIDCRWMFCSISKSIGGSSGSHGSMQQAIRVELSSGDVFEFDSRKEFLEWAASNSK